MRNMQLIIYRITQKSVICERNCMQTEAIVKSALPMALVASGITYALSSVISGGKVGKVMTVFMGISGYIIGKFSYSATCLNKYAPEVMDELKKNKFFKTQSAFEEEEGFTSINEEPETAQSEFSINFNESDDRFDTSSSFEEETIKPNNRKPNLTYAELRKQHRSELYKTYKSPRHTEKPLPKQDEKVFDDSSLSSETTEDTIWG
ncbi:uncharacterized protein LOC143187808 isoform X2 [Calliopsis andreniformis]|uniref:uncharacterized protein LOC143187808 isoform X2 n=1 Tax=Calliopsis andreniformis TaxID=337506 RepID=UPI003FCE91AE